MCRKSLAQKAALHQWADPRDFPRAQPEGNPEDQPCQPEENLIHPDYFTQIYILSKIGREDWGPVQEEEYHGREPGRQEKEGGMF